MLRQSSRLAQKQREQMDQATATEPSPPAPSDPPSAAAAAAAPVKQKKQMAAAKKLKPPRVPVAAPPPPLSKASASPSFTFKRVTPTTVPLAPAATPIPAQRVRNKSAKAKEAEEAPFDNDTGLDVADLGPTADVDVFVSALGLAEEDGDDTPSNEASYFAQAAALVDAYGGALPAFADATSTHVPVLSGKEAAVVDWKGAGPGLAAVRCISDCVMAHEAGGAVNVAVLSALRGRLPLTVPAPGAAHLNPGSSSFFLCLGSKGIRGVSLSLELRGEGEPLRLFLPLGAMAKLGPATAASLMRTTLAPVTKEGAGAEETALVLSLHDTARVKDKLTGKIESRAAGLALTTPAALHGKKRKVAGAPGKIKGTGAKVKGKKEGDEDSANKENEGPNAAAATKEKKGTRRKALHVVKGAAKKAKK